MPGSSRPRSSAPVLRSLSPHRFYIPSSSSSSRPSISPDYSSSPFASSTHLFNHRSASPPHVTVTSSRPPSSISSSSVRFSTDRPVSPNRSLVVSPRHHHDVLRNGDRRGCSSIKKTCMCSPTLHPGSFRCSLHKNAAAANGGGGGGGRNGGGHHHQSFMRSNMIWSLAMKNSLVRIGGVEGDLVRRALTALIHPSSHQQRRRAAFQLRPSRLSVMSKASDP